MSNLNTITVNASAWARVTRERDEAREDARRATYDAAQETIKVSTVKSHWIEACRERDEAREAFVVATNSCVDAQQRLREMEDQRDFAMSEMERLKRERDEARKALRP